ncbi:MAG: peptide MFS transporter [Bacteroidales bacterium]|nr:peptide MFS transporter [Bacteroidales bacterium]MBN2818189.1 peptide MFS transporter [Bacteroidales bacterium]
MTSSIKHPKGLMVLFFTEMWERFSYYGMRALLVLYLTAELVSGGFGMERGDALKIYAIFTGLVYMTPIIGGFLADKFLGQRKAVFIGAFLMAIGQFFMAFSQFGELEVREFFRNNGLGLIIVGTGFFKANISTIVGALYSENDIRKDAAFTIFYMGINVGALIGPLIAGSLGEGINWCWGFSAAGVGMVISTIWFYAQRDKLGLAGMPPGREPKEGEAFYHLTNKDRLDIVIYVVANVGLIWGILKLWGSLPETAKSVIQWILIIGGIGFVLYLIAANTKGKQAWSRLSVIFILAFFNIFFWSGYEQAGGTFNLFAEQQTDRTIGTFEFPATWFQSVSALYIVVFASLFAALWLRLNVIGKEPRTPVKFGMGLLLMSIGFVIMNYAAKLAGDNNLISPMWLLIVYFMHTMGELCLSPIGLSMVTKLAPQKIVSLMMGIWFASIATANYLAGVLESILQTYLPNMHLFAFLTLSTFSAGVLALLLSPILNRMMKGVH